MVSVHLVKWKDASSRQLLPTSYARVGISVISLTAMLYLVGGATRIVLHTSRQEHRRKWWSEERYFNEERRLAHVASLVPKRSLSFCLSIEVYYPKEKKVSSVGKSPFLSNICEHVTIVNLVLNAQFLYSISSKTLSLSPSQSNLL